MINTVKNAEDKLSAKLSEIMSEIAGDTPLPAFNIEIPADKSNGDFATNAALCSAKALKMPPRKIAEMITEKLSFADLPFSKCEIAGPGFINFFLGDKWYSDTVSGILSCGSEYGRSDFGGGATRIVEFVSANPTGPMHIGNARGGALGDTLAESLSWAGFDVKREFYVNDAGQQVAKFGASLGARYLQICSEAGQAIVAENNEEYAQKMYSDTEKFPTAEGLYLGADIILHAKNFYDQNGDVLAEKSAEERETALADYALPLNIAKLKTDLARYGVNYDSWFFESTLHGGGAVEEIITKLKDSGYTFENDGALWLKTTEFGDEKDRVLVRANGVPTYFVPDIAYHYDKLVKRGFDKAIDVFGADHHGYIPRLKGALKALGIDPDRLDIVIMQMVMLVRDGETVKLSKRSGKAITLETLLDDIPIDAARFFFNLREPNSHFEMDLDLAVEQSSKNPVYYAEYAHARICSIIRNLEAEGISRKDIPLTFTESEEFDLIKTAALLPNVIISAATEYNPSELTKFATALAASFHKFYDKCRIKGESETTLQSRLALIFAVRQTMYNALKILGITAPERM
jgi:arginyl-tRNA synthetase